ncbi:transmembrane protein 42-like [Corticium candelabrum]|uniref:transmembrane protein 42-like n=1 Tax=Corticium candelabrum TaxID=121492 RepID=UPI002E2646B9|nr:transmembrane protein 42-like [Corticium candelabrum]
MFFYACAAGLCGALASTTAKLTSSPSTALTHRSLCWFLRQTNDIHQPCEGPTLIVSRILWCSLTILLNVLMWLTFTRSLQHSSSSSEALVINLATNFCLSALIGVVFFGECLSVLWCVGATMIVCGIAIMQRANCAQEEDKKKRS